MKSTPKAPQNSRPIYAVSPCYRLVMPEAEQAAPSRREDHRYDTPRGSAVRRPTLPW